MMKYCLVILSLQELNINLQTISTNDVIQNERKNTSVSIENNERKYFMSTS